MLRQQLAGAAIIGLAAFSLVACQKPAANAAGATTTASASVDKAKISDAVKADANAMLAAFNAKDADKAVSHDAPGMVGMFHGTPNVVGAEQDLAMTKKQFAEDSVGKVEVSNETVDVANSGDMAVYRATYRFSGTDPKTKKPVTETGNWVVGYGLQPDGSWKITWNVVSDTGPPPAAAAPAKAG